MKTIATDMDWAIMLAIPINCYGFWKVIKSSRVAQFSWEVQPLYKHPSLLTSDQSRSAASPLQSPFSLPPLSDPPSLPSHLQHPSFISLLACFGWLLFCAFALCLSACVFAFANYATATLLWLGDPHDLHATR